MTRRQQLVDTAALSRIDPDLVQILAETDC